MGAPLKSEIEAWSDVVAGMLQANMDNLGVPINRSGLSLFDRIGASSDPDVVVELCPAARLIDALGLPDQNEELLSTVLGRTPYRAFAKAFRDEVTSDDEGGYSSVQAYLDDVAALIHPVFGELLRKQFGEGSLTASGESQCDVVFPPLYSSIFPTHAYTGADGSLVDDTTDVSDAGEADVALFAANGRAVYLGATRKFNRIVIALSTLGSSTITPLIEYWTGTSWKAVSGLSDGTSGFTKQGVISFDAPVGWGRWYKDKSSVVFTDEARLYYIRIARTNAVLVTPPVGICFKLIPTPLLHKSTGKHAALDQPPLGLIVVTGANTATFIPIASVSHTRFRPGAVKFRALTKFSADVTVTLAYTNQAGASASQAQAAFTAPVALDEAAITLAGSDDGMRAIVASGSSIVCADTAGVIEVYAPRLRTPTL